jgi:hypothetical protein
MAAPRPTKNRRWKPQSIEETLKRRLASAGLTDIEIVPSSFVVRAKNADGRSVIRCSTPIQTECRSVRSTMTTHQRAHPTRNAANASAFFPPASGHNAQSPRIFRLSL